MSKQAMPDDALASRIGALQRLVGPYNVRFCKIAAEGNRAFGRGDDVLAGWLHEDALAEADALFEAPSGMSLLIAPMAYTIACKNAAEAKARTGDPGSAYELKLRAVTRLIAVAQSPAEPLILRLSCARQLRHALAFLMADGETTRPAQLDSLLEQYRTVITELAQIAATSLCPQEGTTSYNSSPSSGAGTPGTAWRSP